MPLNPWLDQSEKNLGLVIRGDQSPLNYSPQDFFDETQQAIIQYIQDNPDYDKEDLYAKFSSQILDSALHSVMSLNGSGKEINWPDILRKTKTVYEISDEFEKIGKQGKRTGELPDPLELRSKLDSFSRNEKTGLQCSKNIDWQSAKGLIKCGWDAIDETIGGIAESGPVVVYGPTKTGKSFWTAKLVKEFLKFYPSAKAAIFPLELTDKRYLKRAFEVYPDLLVAHDEGRLFLTSKIRNIQAISDEVSRTECDIVIIDGVDGLVRGDYSPGTFAKAWSGVIELGVTLDIPIIVTAQPNRTGKWLANKEFIDRYSIEWSGAAENGAEQLIALQYIEYAIDFEDNRFPVFDDTYYMISWLQREGWRNVPIEGPGAVIFKPEDAEYHINKDGKKERIPWGGKAHGREINGKMIPALWRVQPKGTKIAQGGSRRKE